MTKKHYRKMLRALMTKVWKDNGLDRTLPMGQMLKNVRDAGLGGAGSYEKLWDALVVAFPREAAHLEGGRK